MAAGSSQDSDNLDPWSRRSSLRPEEVSVHRFQVLHTLIIGERR